MKFMQNERLPILSDGPQQPQTKSFVVGGSNAAMSPIIGGPLRPSGKFHRSACILPAIILISTREQRHRADDEGGDERPDGEPRELLERQEQDDEDRRRGR